jgi:hypothetical protein
MSDEPVKTDPAIQVSQEVVTTSYWQRVIVIALIVGAVLTESLILFIKNGANTETFAFLSPQWMLIIGIVGWFVKLETDRKSAEKK